MSTSISLKHQCFSEFFGTGLFIFLGVSCLMVAVICGVPLSLWEIAAVWGLSITLAVYLTAGISGAHLNPAITIALSIFAGFDVKKVIPFIFSQTMGAFSGAALSYLLYQNLFIDYELKHGIVRGSIESLKLAGIFSTYPNPLISTSQAFFVELIITSILMCLILSLTDEKNSANRGILNPLLIGILVAVIGTATAPLTGFAMNPARDFGPKLFAYLAGWGNIAFTGGRSIPYVYVPLIAPVLGTCFGCIVYKFFFDLGSITRNEKLTTINTASISQEES
nr:MIP/aquaporin family protein [uncultured Tolumonas sp.]